MIQEAPPTEAAHAVADTLKAAGEHGEKFAFSHLLEHIKDSHEVEIPGGHIELPHFQPVTIAGVQLDLSPTKHVFFLLFAGILLCLLAVYVARRYKKSLVPSGVANAFEVPAPLDGTSASTVTPAPPKYGAVTCTSALSVVGVPSNTFAP